MKTIEDYQGAVDLTPSQRKAFDSLKRAVSRCRKEHILFYMNLESLGALNGKKIVRITDSITEKFADDSLRPDCLQNLIFPTVQIECSFADDNHCVVLKKP